MSVASSAGGQSMRVGIRATKSARRAAGQAAVVDDYGLARAVERGWRWFWQRRGLYPPQVSKTQMHALPFDWYARSDRAPNEVKANG